MTLLLEAAVRSGGPCGRLALSLVHDDASGVHAGDQAVFLAGSVAFGPGAVTPRGTRVGIAL